MKNIMLIAMSLVLIFVVGCAGSKGSSKQAYSQSRLQKLFPMSQNGGRLLMKKRDMSMVKVKVHQSKDVSRMKAKNDVMNDLQQKSKAVTEGRSSFFSSETGTDFDSELMTKFDNVQNSIWGGALDGWVEIKSQTVVENTQDQNGRKKTIYRTYILGAIDQGAQDKKLLAQINRDKQLRLRLKLPRLKTN